MGRRFGHGAGEPFGHGAGAARAVAAALGLPTGSSGAAYVADLATVAPTVERYAVPSLDRREADARCTWLGLTAADAADVVATLPAPSAEPAWWWCVERAATRLLGAIGDLGAPAGRWPGFEGPAHSLARRCHMLHVALAVAPATAGFLRRQGASEPVVRASLGDLARHAAIHRRVHGLTGIEADWWGAVCLRGELVELGRLQYTRFSVDGDDDDPEDAAARSLGYRTGEECLAVHIPEAGPLLPVLVDESLAAAGRFFSVRECDSGRPLIATCRSWLLDPQLTEYLPEDSNIVRFQRRFQLLPGSEPGDRDVLEFVFRVDAGAAGVELGALPQRTTMERAAVDHLRAGRHWARRTGWLTLPWDEAGGTGSPERRSAGGSLPARRVRGS